MPSSPNGTKWSCRNKGFWRARLTKDVVIPEEFADIVPADGRFCEACYYIARKRWGTPTATKPVDTSAPCKLCKPKPGDALRKNLPYKNSEHSAKQSKTKWRYHCIFECGRSVSQKNRHTLLGRVQGDYCAVFHVVPDAMICVTCFRNLSVIRSKWDDAVQDEGEAVNGEFPIARLLDVQFTSQVIQRMHLQCEDIFNLTEVVEDVYEKIPKPRGIPDYAPLLTLGMDMSVARKLVDTREALQRSVQVADFDSVADHALSSGEKMQLLKLNLLLEGRHDKYVLEHQSGIAASHLGEPGKLHVLAKEELQKRMAFVAKYMLTQKPVANPLRHNG